jgi:cytoskeletal protein RodZ
MPILFSTKKLASSNNSLGDVLKNTRLKHKLKLHHVEQYTNIRKSYIIAIENNQWDNLPSLEYARKFTITYAKFLEIDTQKIINRFDIETKTYSQNLSIKNLNPVNSHQFIITPKTLTIFSAICIFVFVGIYAYMQINYFLQIPVLNISEPADYTEVSVNKIDFKGKTDPDNVIFINNQLLTTDKNGNFATPVQLKNGYNIIKVTAENKIGKSITTTKVVVANLEQIDTPTTESLSLSISANEQDVWIRIKNQNSQTVFDGIIPAGSSRQFDEHDTLYLSTSNAGSTSISINNQFLGPIGENSQIIEDLQISNQPATNKI